MHSGVGVVRMWMHSGVGLTMKNRPALLSELTTGSVAEYVTSRIAT